MKLSEWQRATETQKREFILSCLQNETWNAYESLAMEAARSLGSDLQRFPEVVLVELAGGGILFADSPCLSPRELLLSVSTFLSGTQKLNDLPNQHFGFRVQQVNLGDERNAYLRTWTLLFRELRDWSEQETLTWSLRWSEAFKSGASP